MKICPRDGTVMATNDVDGYRYFSCERCCGHWIPGHAGRRALKGPVISLLKESAGPSSIPCPACKCFLQTFKVEGCEVDVCGACHGLWLDGDEIVNLADLFPETSQILSSVRGRKTEQKWSGVFAVADATGQVINLLFIHGP